MGTPIVAEQSIKLLEPDELIVYDIVYSTIVDCYKVATAQWRHFLPMEWHDKKDYFRILTTARRKLEEWIECDQFADYVAILKWNPECAKAGLREVLDGRRNAEVKILLKQIAKERDARRDREENFNVRN